MKENENALKRRIEVGQFAELSACVIKQLPRDIDTDIAQGWIKNPAALKRVIRNALCPPSGMFLYNIPVGRLDVLASLRESGYLDTSFEGKETHPLTIRPLTKEQALYEYKNSGGKTWIWNELEKNMPYAIPKAETLDVMIMNFGKSIGSDEALAKMDKLGVRTLPPEPLLQYGIARPNHQKQNPFVSLTKIILDGVPRAPILYVDDGVRCMDASDCGVDWGAVCRFPVVCKEKSGDYNYFLDS